MKILFQQPAKLIGQRSRLPETEVNDPCDRLIKTLSRSLSEFASRGPMAYSPLKLGSQPSYFRELFKD